MQAVAEWFVSTIGVPVWPIAPPDPPVVPMRSVAVHGLSAGDTEVAVSRAVDVAVVGAAVMVVVEIAVLAPEVVSVDERAVVVPQAQRVIANGSIRAKSCALTDP